MSTACSWEKMLEEERNFTRSVHRHGIWFYQYGQAYPKFHFHKNSEPSDFLDDCVYDILFVAGYWYEQTLSRTSEGKATMKNKKLMVEFTEQEKKLKKFFSMADFSVSELQSAIYKGNWVCVGDVMIEENCSSADVIHADNEPRLAQIFQLAQGRTACSLCEDENYDDNIELSIEEAEKLQTNHDNRHERSWLVRCMNLPPEMAKLISDFNLSCPNPVLFFEPGDLVIQVEWDETSDDTWFEVVMRRREVSRKRKHKHQADENMSKRTR